MNTATARHFKSMCRQWRQVRKLSQLDLALAANVSQRHVSWLETGRSIPSRDMVERLSDAMDIPLRERNLLMQSAGYASTYNETELDDPAMAPVLEALTHVLTHHQPLPAVVVDRLWNVKMKNQAASLLMALDAEFLPLLESISDGPELNLAVLTLHPQGLRKYMVNWEQAAPAFLQRLRHEALASGDPQMHGHFAYLSELAGLTPTHTPQAASAVDTLLPVLPLELDINGVELSLFSVISTFGTPQDITTDELRIEAFYPTTQDTADFFSRLAEV